MLSSYVDTFVVLLRTLGLVEGSYKPIPGTPVSDSLMNKLNNDTSYSMGYSNFLGPGSLSAPVDTEFNFSHPQLYDETVLHPPIAGTAASDPRCSVVPYDPPPPINQSFSPFDAVTATIYRYRQQQAVNLGSWFVQENWMVPSLFTCASEPRTAEIDVASGWGSPENARAILERHWDTFINQSDFNYLASIGINTVRLPIGYWMLGPDFVEGTPFASHAQVYTNAWPRVVGAINMAAQSGIGVLVDLHGAVGSQNGQSHSGISDGQTRLFTNPAYMNKTMKVLTHLAQQLQFVTNVVGIEILNEPVDVPTLPEFYSDAIMTMRQNSHQGGQILPMYIHDAFNIQQYSSYLSGRSDFVVEDHHSYFVFTPADDSEPASQHTSDVRGAISSDLGLASAKARGNLVISEWSCALTAQSLLTQHDQDGARRQFCTTQMGVYANTSAGWSFWSYDKEDCDGDQGWCFKAAVGKSLPGTFFSYGKPPPLDPVALQRSYSAVASMVAPSRRDILRRLESFQMVIQGSSPITPWNATTSQQQSLARGYSDGYQTAKMFTQHGWSRLGFTEQYIQDSLSAMNGDISRGTEDYYRAAFRAGLADGEAVVLAALS